MTRDDIIRMAREAGWTGIYSEWSSPTERTSIEVPVTMEQIERFAAIVAAAEREKYDALFAEIKEWSEAYPETVFPQPDWGKVRDALEMNGMTLDSVSAANMRHVIKHIQEMVDETIRARSQ